MSEIQDMTIDQMRMHLKAYTKKNLLDQINKVALDAVAAQGDKKAIESTMKNLQSVIKEIERS